jgi:hypothetical protein
MAMGAQWMALMSLLLLMGSPPGQHCMKEPSAAAGKNLGSGAAFKQHEFGR